MANLRTVLSIIQDAVSEGLGLARDPIANDIINEAVAKYRLCGKHIYDRYPWDAKRVDPFLTSNTTYVTSYSTTTGIIVFTSLVDAVRAIRPNGTDGTPGFNSFAQDDINAAMRGVTVDGARFIHMPDGADGVKRIQVNVDAPVTAAFTILATLRFVPATVEASYSAGSPSATPTDYRVLTWPLHRAEGVLVSYMADELRAWDGQSRKGDWAGLLETEIGALNRQENREFLVVPEYGNFGDSGSWWGGTSGYSDDKT